MQQLKKIRAIRVYANLRIFILSLIVRIEMRLDP